MKLILLCIGASDIPLLSHLGATERFRVLGWHESEDTQSNLRELFSAGRRIPDRAAFDRAAVSSVVLVGTGGGLEERESLLRDLARDAVPLAMIQPPCSGIFAAEMDMIQQDTDAPMIPLHPDSLHPAIDFLSKSCSTWTDDTPNGKIEQIVMERQTEDRSPESVKRLLAQDALLMRRLIGSFQKVGGMESSADDGSFANLSVHLTGNLSAITRWSVGPVIDDAGGTISLIGQRGKVTLHLPDDRAWYFSTTADNPDFLPTETDFAIGEALADQIEGGLDRKSIAPTWEDAYRAIDLADTASESIRRGKTLPINNARLTEEDTFKSLMAAGGCLIILVLPLLLLLVSLVDGLQIPYNKTLQEQVAAGRRNVALPADLSALTSIAISSEDDADRTLRLVTRSELYREFGVREKGTPQAFATNRNEIMLAPVPDQAIQLTMRYKGSFNIWKGWPLVLLLPIVFFLLLQLLKLVFPKHKREESRSEKAPEASAPTSE